MPSYRKLEPVDCFFSTAFNLKYMCEGFLVSRIICSLVSSSGGQKKPLVIIVRFFALLWWSHIPSH